MKRALFLFSIALIIGILSAYLSKSNILIPIILILLFAFFILSFKKIKMTLFVFIGILLFYSFGAVEYIYINNINVNCFKEIAGKQVVIKGYIASEPDIRDSKINYIINTKTISELNIEKIIKGKILLTTLKADNVLIYSYGSEIELRGQLNIPKGKRNPGGFDYQRYLSQSGVSATIFSKSTNIKIGKLTDTNIFVKTGLKIRSKIISVIEESLPAEQAGLLNGMLIGYTKGIDDDLQKAFSDAGLSHIMAVSGMNIAFIVFPLVFLFKRFRVKQRYANIFIISTLIIFVFITGFSPSVVRAVIMAIIILAGQLIFREPDIITSLSFSACFLLVLNPMTLFNIGFQLSFAATFSLILFYKNIKKLLYFKYLPEAITELLAVTLSAQVGVLPIIAFYFNKISMISIITNIVVVPLTGVITVLGFIMAILGQINIIFAEVFAYINYSFLTFILFITKISASLPLAIIKITTPKIFIILLYYVLILFFFWYKPKVGIKLKLKYIIAFSGLIIIVFSIYAFYPRGLEVVFIDVGEGDSTFIRSSSGKTVLIDGGGVINSLNRETNVGDTTIIPFLLDYGVSKLDLVIATHGHEDHIQGLLPVIQEFNVSNFVIPNITRKKEFEQLLNISNKRGIKVDFCQGGDMIKLDNKTYFDILHPPANYEVSETTLNNSSLVLKLHFKKISILFTGDVEKEVEEMLINENANISADILKIAHHGSAYSTSSKILEKINPLIAVISVGKNTFGHPSKEVLERLEKEKVQVYRTDESGAIVAKSNGEKIRISKTLN